MNTALATEWARLAQDVELSRSYFLIYSLDGPAAGPNPFLDELLASLCFVRLVSVLDDGLEEYIASNPTVPRPKRPVLNDPIKALESAGRLTSQEAKDLHGLREWRNKVAHEAQPTYVNWTLLDDAIRIADAMLQRLGLVGPLPKYEFFAERSKAEDGDQPDVLFLQRYVAGVRVDGRPELSLHWTQKMLRDKSGGG